MRRRSAAQFTRRFACYCVRDVDVEPVEPEIPPDDGVDELDVEPLDGLVMLELDDGLPEPDIEPDDGLVELAPDDGLDELELDDGLVELELELEDGLL